ncbi:MAG: hypothetical protein WDO70_06750 [Alphaproteobacteria bacterium]
MCDDASCITKIHINVHILFFNYLFVIMNVIILALHQMWKTAMKSMILNDRRKMPRTDKEEMPQGIQEYIAHLEAIAAVFNDHARTLGLGVYLDASNVIAAAKSGIGFSKIKRFIDRADDSGVLHDSQLMTALDCIGELLTSPNQNGLVTGAMQSGKTTTSLALQFSGPIVYLLTGRRLYPIYLITSHTSQEDQTKTEIARFLDFYGELAIVVDEKNRCTLIDYVTQFALDEGFKHSPTVNTYREHILQKALPDTFAGPRLDDFIHRRAPGEGIKQIANLCRRAASKGFEPLLLIDEPQYGASDRQVTTEDDKVEWRSCVLAQIFNRIKEALGKDAPAHSFIGLSATPYELHDVRAVWQVTQYLTSAYSGFNYFGGIVLDPDAAVTPPRTISFADFSAEIEVPFLAKVDLRAYDARPRAFQWFADENEYLGTQDEYRKDVEQALRKAIMYMAGNGTTPATGICIRLFNNNNRSHELLRRLYLNNQEIEIIEYFGSDHHGRSVKRAIAERSCPDLPFLIAVTNRARMGDAFPNEVEWFLEFSKKAADLNSLLQGLLGRACGYGKNSTVIMSNENIRIVDAYKNRQGGFVHKPSRHSVLVGGYRRGAPTSLIRIRRDMNDPLIAKYFARIDQEIVKPYTIQTEPTASLKTTRTRGEDHRRGPILTIAEEIGLFEYIEAEENRRRLFPAYEPFQIVRAGDEVSDPKDSTRKFRYTLGENGDCRFTFRTLRKESAHSGIRSRGLGRKDATDPEQAGNTLEPQVNMVKIDPDNGQIIENENAKGWWRAEAVTLPLLKPVRTLRDGEATYPVQHGPYSGLLDDEERTAAGYEE